MKKSRFTWLLAWAVVMIIGCALIPRIDVAEQPRPRQGKTLSVGFAWHGASAKVVEQNVTSRIEGLVAAVAGVERVTSESYFGSGRVTIELKKNADVSATKFEIASLLRQIKKQLPEGVSYPELSGGEVVNENQQKETTRVLLSYRVNSNLSDEQLKEYIQRQVEPALRQMDDVKRVEVTGGSSKYIVITYDPFVLSTYRLSAEDIENGIRTFLGKSEVVGEVQEPGQEEKRTLYLTTEKFGGPLEQMPIGMIGGKTVYLGDLATYEYKDRLPGSYYRVNGLNTIYLNIHVDAEANKIALSRTLRKEIAGLQGGLRQGVYLTLTHDAAEEEAGELHKLIWRSTLSLFILLLFVWLVRRDWRYLLIMLLTLAANLAAAVICYYIFDLRLHIYSLAGITVSLGMVIDAAVVMVDHYSYYHDRRAFQAILAALLTTIGSLIVVLWLPDFLQKDLVDFAWIIIVNLSVALLVSGLFAPALIDLFGYQSRGQLRAGQLKKVRTWNSFYLQYIRTTQRHKWIYYVILLLLFFGTMRLFSESLSENTYSPERDRDLRLNIHARMPLGGTAAQLNEKVVILENFLVTFPEIERFETRVEAWGASVTVDFKEEFKHTSFPFALENKVIGKVISIGGADWSTSGVSLRGFSNSLNLQHRSSRIEIAGYNYDRLYRIAEEMCNEMRKNNRVRDLIIETPGHEQQEDELCMRYDKERMTLYDFDLPAAHGRLRELLAGRDIDRYRDTHFASDMFLKSAWQDRFDLWRLENTFLKVGETDCRLSDFMTIERREAKNCIPRENQEYVLQVAFNILGSYTYTSRYIERITKTFNQEMPVGFRCRNTSHGYYQDDGTQYWVLGLIVVIIFFVCSILFESLRLPLAIISLIPVSFIGTFLTYWLSEVEFGTGGFASMVLLSGLTVNAGIYIVCEYRNLKAAQPFVASRRLYIRAYNHKITAVFLTILSTILGLVPFFIDDDRGSFWFSFAVGSTGGLLFSILALVFVMPLFLKLSR